MASIRNFFTLYMVTNAVGEEEIMMMGNMFLGFRDCILGSTEEAEGVVGPALAASFSFLNLSAKS